MEGELQQMEQKSNKSSKGMRSRLSTAAFIKWLRTRFRNNNRKNNSYLYFPQDLLREISIEKIFMEFDSDGSGGLSRDQVFQMFNGFGIPITMDNLNKLYDSVEIDMEEMDCEKFKRCALSESSNKVFSEIVKTLGEDAYLPHNFTNMIVYLVYLSKREELRKEIEQEKTGIQLKVEKVQNLLKLGDLSLNNERLNLHADTFKQTLRNRFRDIWEKVNENYGQKFPYTAKLEEEFYDYYLNSRKTKAII